GIQGRVPDSYAGRSLNCRNCSTRFEAQIPPIVGHRSQSHPESLTSRKENRLNPIDNGAHCPHCQQVITPRPKRKRHCPHCNRMVLVRNGILCTETQIEAQEAREKAESEKAWLENVAREQRKQQERFARLRESAAHNLENARALWRDGLADAIEIRLTKDCN